MIFKKLEFICLKTTEIEITWKFTIQMPSDREVNVNQLTQLEILENG